MGSVEAVQKPDKHTTSLNYAMRIGFASAPVQTYLLAHDRLVVGTGGSPLPSLLPSLSWSCMSKIALLLIGLGSSLCGALVLF